MATCPQCNHTVIAGQFGGTTILLDPQYHTYVSVEEAHLYPEDEDRVFLCMGLVEHRAVCSGMRRAQAAQREQGKAVYAKQKGAKA